MTSFSFFKYFDAFELDVNVVNFVYYGKTRKVSLFSLFNLNVVQKTQILFHKSTEKVKLKTVPVKVQRANMRYRYETWSDCVEILRQTVINKDTDLSFTRRHQAFWFTLTQMVS